MMDEGYAEEKFLKIINSWMIGTGQAGVIKHFMTPAAGSVGRTAA